MGELKFTKATDQEHEIKLDSYLIYAEWRSGGAFAGQPARFEVATSFVGNGAKISLEGKSEKGKKLGKIKDTIKNNKYIGSFDIPEDIELGDEIYFKVELSKNGLEGESARIPVFPQPQVENLKWSAPEARRGDILTLSADIKNVQSGTEALVTIYEYDQDGAHDRITELATTVENNKIEVKWEYEYHEDTDEIPTKEEMEKYGGSYNPPEYFFTVKIGEAEFGRQQESGILSFKDYLEIELLDSRGNPRGNEKYIITLPDGTEKEGNLDPSGYAKLEGIPPGTFSVSFPDVET